MKSEKVLLIKFVSHVFKSQDSDELFSPEALSKHTLTAIRMAANDALEVCSMMKKEEQEIMSTELQNMGLPSLETLQNKSFKDFLKIANRGVIKNDKEFRIVRSLSETSVLNKEHQEIAYRLLESQ